MTRTAERFVRRQLRHRRIRKRVVGLPARPRLCVFRSHKHLYAQLVDDFAGKTLVGCSTKDKRLKPVGKGSNVAAATALGQLLAAEATKQGITQVVFDRSGYLYHGRIKAFADAARTGGLVL